MLPNIDYTQADRFIDSTGHLWRRNGKTKVWKTRPGEFRIPVKHGLYAYDAITHLNCAEVQVSSEAAIRSGRP